MTEPSSHDIPLKLGLRLRGGKDRIRQVTTKVPHANAWFTHQRLRLDHCDGIVQDRVLERGVFLVRHGGTQINAESECVYGAISTQTHAAIEYGFYELTGELARLEGLLGEAEEIHGLALRYADRDRAEFERALTGASAIFEDLRLARSPEKVHARDRAVIVQRLVTRRNPGAVAATALGLLANLQRRSLDVQENLAPGVAKRALALIELKDKWVKNLGGLAATLISIEQRVRDDIDDWNDHKALSKRLNVTQNIGTLAGRWYDRNVPNPFNGIVDRSTSNLFRIERLLKAGKHQKAHVAILAILEDLERTFFLDEVEAARYAILRYGMSGFDDLCHQVSNLIAIARHLYEFNVTDHLKMPGVLDTLFEALFYASHGEADKVRDVLKGAARQLN
ncbi:hypothetical protein HOI83_00570 [Candidatus Uhrbacteria bacterium]|jgi:hypothetical protein|nr:hypothetical protein [Candidatus Uhrbacteria bacterium]